MICTLETQLKDALVHAMPGLQGKDIVIRVVSGEGMWDMAVVGYAIAKKLHLTPEAAAQSVVKVVGALPFVERVERVKAYANIYLKRTPFAHAFLQEALQEPTFGSARLGQGKRALLEHTSINPNASPHVGRARNAFIGDCIGRGLRFQGYETTVKYYVNDMGKQIALLVLAIRERGGTDGIFFDDLLGIYVQANEKTKTSPEYEKQAMELLHEYEQGEQKASQEFRSVVQKCLNGQVAILRRCGIAYDQFDWESKYAHSPQTDECLVLLKEKGALFTDEMGREVVDMSKIGFTDPAGQFLVLRRASGSSMYVYRDIAYTLEKVASDTEENLVVLGEDHKLYFKQLSTVLQVCGAKAPEPIHYAHILLREGKMSTRQGTVVLLSDFLNEASARAKARVSEACDEITAEEIEQIAQIIGLGAVKFAILSVAPWRNVTFDWEQALQFEGDSGPYVQYSCARIASILRKYGKEVGLPKSLPSQFEEAEWQLLLALGQMEAKLAEATINRNPALVASYALTVAKAFSRFFVSCPVLKAESKELLEFRVALCKATHRVLTETLGLLGIDAPERM